MPTYGVIMGELSCFDPHGSFEAFCLSAYFIFSVVSRGNNDGDVWMVIPKSSSNGAHTVYTQNAYSKPADSLIRTLNIQCIDRPGFPTQNLGVVQQF